MTELRGDIVVLRPLQPEDAPRLREIHVEPAVAAWWGRMDDGFPDDEPESTRFTIRVGGEIAGMIQYGEESEPKYRHASIDLFVAPAHHRQGVATEAIGLVVEHLIATLGHHRITIDPAAANAAAVGCYAKAGFRPVGTLRRAERDSDGAGWHDILLMELVVEG